MGFFFFIVVLFILREQVQWCSFCCPSVNEWIEAPFSQERGFLFFVSDSEVWEI